MRVLAIDYGAKRMGLAISDREGKFAFVAGTLERHGAKQDIAALVKRITDEKIELIVFGLPLHMNGKEGPEAAAVRSFGAKLQEACQLPVDFFDERMTTLEAKRALQAAGVSSKKQKVRIDETAASILLRAYLESTKDLQR